MWNFAWVIYARNLPPLASPLTGAPSFASLPTLREEHSSTSPPPPPLRTGRVTPTGPLPPGQQPKRLPPKEGAGRGGSAPVSHAPYRVGWRASNGPPLPPSWVRSPDLGTLFGEGHAEQLPLLGGVPGGRGGSNLRPQIPH